MSQANESLKNDIYVRHAKQSLREQKEGSLKPFCLQQQLVQRMFCFFFVIHFINLFCLVSTTTTMLLFFIQSSQTLATSALEGLQRSSPPRREISGFFFENHYFFAICNPFSNFFCLIVSTTTTMLLFFFSILPDIGNERDRRFATLLTTPRNKVKLLLLLRLLLKLTAKPFSCSLCNAHTQSLFQLGSMGAFQVFFYDCLFMNPARFNP